MYHVKIVSFQACGETLIAPNPVEAEKMAFGHRHRHRVVALTGELVEPTGTITGGGAKPKSGAMGERPTVRVNEG